MSLKTLSPPLPSESEAGRRPVYPSAVGLLDVTNILGGLKDLRAAVLITAWGISESEMEPAEDERVYPPGGRMMVGVEGFEAE